jgi:hypothetical protein
MTTPNITAAIAATDAAIAELDAFHAAHVRIGDIRADLDAAVGEHFHPFCAMYLRLADPSPFVLRRGDCTAELVDRGERFKAELDRIEKKLVAIDLDGPKFRLPGARINRDALLGQVDTWRAETAVLVGKIVDLDVSRVRITAAWDLAREAQRVAGEDMFDDDDGRDFFIEASVKMAALEEEAAQSGDSTEIPEWSRQFAIAHSRWLHRLIRALQREAAEVVNRYELYVENLDIEAAKIAGDRMLDRHLESLKASGEMESYW